MKGTTSPLVCRSRCTVPNRHAMLKRRVNHDSPTTSRDLRYSGRISSIPKALPPWSFLTTSVTSAWVMKESNPESPASAFTRECVMAGLRRSSSTPSTADNVPSRGQQLPTTTVNSDGEARLPPPEVSRRFARIALRSYSMASPGPISRLRSPTSQPQLIGLLLQLDSIPYCQCSPLGSGIAAATGTSDLTATAGSIDNGGGEYGPLGLHVSNLPLCSKLS
ncbi:hypothetical protein ILYODFUR_009440 [Ilyodon furcidens]|uniref:Uncharacterized protein n=1 Tax=Ilyodon furcidens TaxID=33524 RepID=A0ABV0U5T7_9TELE